MKRTSIEYVAEGTNGTLFARAENDAYSTVASVSIDSRTIPEDCLFFCIIGERVDAHKFLPDVRERGCHNVVVSDPVWASKMAAAGDMNVVLVEDTRLALIALGTRYLDDWKGLRKVGVTGSVGKTSTKEFLYSVLRSRYRTGKTLGNLNSEFGIPLTAFNFDEDIEVAVIEMGVGYGSPMEILSGIAKPEAAVVTNVGTSHLEVFGTREKLLEEKLRVSTGFTPANTLVINTDCDILSLDNAKSHQPSDAKIVTAGSDSNADYMLYNVCDCGIDGVKCMIAHCGQEMELALPTIGAHNLGNAAEAIAIGEVFGIPMEEGIRALASVESNDNRLDVIRGKQYTVINDTYNASPESMKAGIDVLMHSPGQRKVAVLGSMFELGENEAALHGTVGEYAAAEGVDVLITVGELAENISKAAAASGSAMEIHHYDDRETAQTALAEILREGDLVYVKASNSMQLFKLVDYITDADR